MAKQLVDPEVDSDFARQKALSKETGTPPGIDPETGERAAVTYRQLYNETGDEQVAGEIFDAVARAGGYGDVDRSQALDIKGLRRSVEENKVMAEHAEDRFAKDRLEKQAREQDRLVNEVGEVLRRLERG